MAVCKISKTGTVIRAMLLSSLVNFWHDSATTQYGFLDMTRSLTTTCNRVLALALFIAMFTIATPAGADMPEAQKIAERLAGLTGYCKGHISKVAGSSAFILLQNDGGVSAGSLLEVLNDNGNVTGLLKVTVVEKKNVIAKIIDGRSSIAVGRGSVHGISPPARILWLDEQTKDAEALSILAKVQEVARKRGDFDMPPSDTAYYFIKKFGATGLATHPAKEFEKLAKSAGADLIAIASVSKKDEEVSVSVTILSRLGTPVEVIKEKWTEKKEVLVSHVKPQQTGDSEAISTIEKYGEGFLGKKWNGSRATRKKDHKMEMDIRGRVTWNRYIVNGTVVSATWFKTGIVGEKLLAVLTLNRIRFMSPQGGDRLKTVWERRLPLNLAPVSINAFDTNKDNIQELFINAYRKGKPSSIMIDKPKGTYEIIKDGMPYYFSTSSDGVLLAQNEPEVFTVSRTGQQRLEFVRILTLSGNDIPLGINRIDVDDDGTDEVVGISSKGELLIYSPSGRLAWKGGGFGTTGRGIPIAKEGKNSTLFPVPPRVLMVADEDAGRTLAIAGAEYKEGGFFKSNSFKNGVIWFITVEDGEYTVQDTLRLPEGWISDLIKIERDPTNRSQIHEDTIGYIRVYPGLALDESEIILPTN